MHVHYFQAFLAEVSIKSIAQKLYKYMEHNQTKRWIDVLPQVLHAKNNRKNRALGGLSSNDVTFSNQHIVYKTLYGNDLAIRDKSKKKPLPIGTKVQMMPDSRPFTKSYAGYFTNQVYRIHNVRRHLPDVFRYSLTDTSDDIPLHGTWYGWELLEVPSDMAEILP